MAGAQLFARADLDLRVIMLIGRWGSSAICRYVQEEAALANQTRQLAILPAVLDQVRAVVADCFRGQGVLVHNVRSKLAHKPCATECSTPSGDWQSVGGSTGRQVVNVIRLCFRDFVIAPYAFLKRVRSPKCLSIKASPQKLQTRPPLRRKVARAMAAPMSFDEMCDKAAVHPTVRMLFKAKGVDVPGVLHHLFADRTKVSAFLEPLRDGVELQGDTKRRSADELLIDQATVLEWLDVIAAIKTAAVPAAVPAAASASTSASSVEKSQELPAGYWNDFVTDSKSLVVDGRNRQFPAHLLVGAEKTLGRMVAEKKSGLYTALPLGEILFSTRTEPLQRLAPLLVTVGPHGADSARAQVSR